MHSLAQPGIHGASFPELPLREGAAGGGGEQGGRLAPKTEPRERLHTRAPQHARSVPPTPQAGLSVVGVTAQCAPQHTRSAPQPHSLGCARQVGMNAPSGHGASPQGREAARRHVTGGGAHDRGQHPAHAHTRRQGDGAAWAAGARAAAGAGGPSLPSDAAAEPRDVTGRWRDHGDPERAGT